MAQPKPATWTDMQQKIKQFVKNELQSLSKNEQFKLQLTNEMGFKDETVNFFKLKLYNWNVNDAILYYQYDEFCLEYCINKNYRYGCQTKQCVYKHSMNLSDLVCGNLQTQRDCKKGELLCLYLMYKNVFNDNNPQLFNMYAWILYMTGKSLQDYLKSERYFLKALAIDNNCHTAHNTYAILLQNKLNNYDKAEYHFNQSLTIKPNDAINHINFSFFLIDQRQKHQLALSHTEKACQLRPDLSVAHYVKAISLYFLNKFDLSLKEYESCLKLNEKDARLSAIQVQSAKKKINILKDKTRKEMISQKREENKDEKSDVIITKIGANVSKFDKLSIIEGIDDIIADIIEMEGIIDDNNHDNGLKKNIKQCLTTVQTKLASTRTKCNVIDKIKSGVKSEFEKNISQGTYTYNDLRMQIKKVAEEIQSKNKSTLSMIVEAKKIEQKMEMKRQKMEVDFAQLLGDIKAVWNKLGDNDAIDSFEKKWHEWSVDDTIEWFEFVLNSKSLNLNNEMDYEIEDYSGDESSDNDDEIANINKEIDFQHIKSHLFGIEFNAKEDLPILVKPFQFKRFGFKNKKDCKLLCKKTNSLVKKYPKQRKKAKKKASGKEFKENENMHDSNWEGFVQDTHQALE